MPSLVDILYQPLCSSNTSYVSPGFTRATSAVEVDGSSLTRKNPLGVCNINTVFAESGAFLVGEISDVPGVGVRLVGLTVGRIIVSVEEVVPSTAFITRVYPSTVLTRSVFFEKPLF